jgi:hypothetical protein
LIVLNCIKEQEIYLKGSKLETEDFAGMRWPIHHGTCCGEEEYITGADSEDAKLLSQEGIIAKKEISQRKKQQKRYFTKVIFHLVQFFIWNKISVCNLHFLIVSLLFCAGVHLFSSR